MANLEDVKNVQPLADFNWDEFENGTNVEVSKEELVKAYDETLNKIQEAQVVEGIVSSIDKKEVVVNIGYKSDGVIPACRKPGRQTGAAHALPQESPPTKELGKHQ